MSKIVTFKDLLKIVGKLKTAGKKIVLATGCFDILHSAHKTFLENAKKKGDVLIVGLESDSRICRLKGRGRPVNSWGKRAGKLASVGEVDFVFPLPENLEKKKVQDLLISEIKPQVLAVSSHTPNLDSKKKLVEKYNGQLKIVLLHDPELSTSKILNSCPKPVKAENPRD